MRTFVTMVFMLSASPALAAPVYLECRGESTTHVIPPVREERQFGMALDFATLQISYRGNAHRMYDVTDSKISAYSRRRTPKVRFLTQISLDRVTGEARVMELSTGGLKPGDYGVDPDYDDDDEVYGFNQTITAKCVVRDRLF